MFKCYLSLYKYGCGNVAIIPTIINNEIPLPIPLSVIFSPNHIAKIQPVTNIVTDFFFVFMGSMDDLLLD